MASLPQTFHPASILVAAALGIAAWTYACWWRRLRAVHGAAEVRRRHATMFGAGLAVLALAQLGPLDWVAERRLMAGHMVQHLLVVSLAPALLLVGVPRVGWPRPVLDAPAAAVARSAVFCAIGGVAVVWLLHVPPVLDAGLRRPALNDLQHAPLLLAGLALAWPLAGPRPVAGLPAVAYLAAVSLLVGVLGVWLTWFPDVVYAGYLEVPRLWGLDAKTDQSLAGAILLVVEEPFIAVEVAILFIRALQDPADEDDDGSDASAQPSGRSER